MVLHSLFWAKIQLDTENGHIKACLSIAEHGADVAACCESLLSQPVVRHRLASLVHLKDLTSRQCARLCVFAALHDIGKFNRGFQNKKLAVPPFKAGHVREILALFDAISEYSDRLSQAINIDSVNNWAIKEDAACRLLIAAISHHGKPIQVGTSISKLLWEADDAIDPFEGIAHLVQLTQKWFPEAWQEDQPDLPYEPAFQHAFCGLVTLSDWLGSDTRFFPFETSPHIEDSEVPDRMTFARIQSNKAIESIGLSTEGFRYHLSPSGDLFQKISDYTPHLVQQGIIAAPIDRDGITILEAPTGNGKTEAALVRFIQLFMAGAVDGMYFALPTRSAATQLHQRVVKSVQRAFPNSLYRPPVTLAVPGYIQVDDHSGSRLPHFNVLWNDDDSDHWRFRGWASEHPKRYLAGAIVVGTIDQVLLSRLTVPHAHMRSFCLFRHLLVIDEVHASDAYMNAILEEVLRWHFRAGGHALLMSATLASTVRQRLVFPDKPPHPPSLDEAVKTAFPLITHRTGTHQTDIAFQTPADRKLSVEIEIPINSCEWIAKTAVSFAGQGAHVLIIRNRVRDCLETQQMMESLFPESVHFFFQCHGQFAPHHARYPRSDRQSLDLALESEFGKGRPMRGRICIATQTVQQSLDLDADIEITDICPMDVMLQRVGRLHRHDMTERPAGFERPRLIVITPSATEFDGFIHSDGNARGPIGIGTVYENVCVLEATRQLLEKYPVLSLPGDCRLLVESALHPESLQVICREKGAKWLRHHEYIQGQYCGMKRQANLNIVNWDADFGDTESLFPSKNIGGKVATRLGEGDRLIRFPESIPSPFEGKVSELTLPAWSCRNISPEAMPENITSTDNVIEFSLSNKNFVYDRWGIRPQEWGISSLSKRLTEIKGGS